MHNINSQKEIRISRQEMECIAIQKELCSKIIRENTIELSQVQYVAGVDLAYWKKEEQEYAVCCIVILDAHSHEVLDQTAMQAPVNFPYIPGCLAFRELPLFLEANQRLKINPDLYFFDGNGYLHPRHMGLATHAGILLGKPTIGVAKSYYKVEEADYQMPGEEPFAFTDIIIQEETYGRVLRTHKGVKPIFVSTGNGIDLETATKAVISCITKESHIPLPTRLADIMTHKERKAAW